MQRRVYRKAKLLTAAVLYACTTLWASPAWAQYDLNSVLYGADGPEFMTNKDSNNNKVEMNETISDGEIKGVYGGFSINPDGWGVDLEKV